MSLVNPIALSVNAFDATNNQTFYFTSNGGDQVVKNRITIRRQSDNVVVYQNTVTSFLFEQTVPSGTLVNGTYYNYYFNTYNVADDISANSNVVAFYCYSTPTITFTNFPSTNIINSATYSFNITYNQTEGELLSYLVYYLYDFNGIELSNSGELYSVSTPPINFSHEFTGFEISNQYKIQVKAISQNGTITNSELKTFSIGYYAPTLYNAIKLKNVCQQGFIQVTSNLVGIEGEMGVEPPQFFVHIPDGNEANYIKWGEWFTVPETKIISVWAERYMLDLRDEDNYLLFSQGFDIPTDFQFQSWQYPSKDGILFELYKNLLGSTRMIVELKAGIPTGETTVKNWFELYTDDGDLFQYSNYVDEMNSATNFIVWFKKVGDVYTLLLDVVTSGTGTAIVWDNDASVYPTSDYAEDISAIFPLNQLEVRNGIYDNLNIVSDTSRPYSQAFPEWDFSTILNCDFSSLNGGNTTLLLSQIEGIRLKRRTHGTFDWITLFYKSVEDIESLSFVYNDCIAPQKKDLDYAVVPVLNGNIEGDYNTASVTSEFDGCFLCNGDNVFKLYNACVYPTISNSLQAGQFVPIGSQYPILVFNGANDFESGSFSANLFGYDFETTRRIDRLSVQQQLADLKALLKIKRGIILKDWDGRNFLCTVVGGITETADLISGKVGISFNWVEQGKYNIQADLYENGIIDTQE